MGCSKQLSIAATAVDQFTPLSSAVYVASVGQILGTCENYICRFNAITGAYINQVKVISPMYGPMHLGMVGAVPWLSAWNDKYNMSATAHPLRDIFPVNASTLAIGSALSADTLFGAGSVAQWWGPLSFVSIGTGIYFVYTFNGAVQLCYIDSANHATNNSYTLGYTAHQFGVSATHIYCPDNFNDEIRYFDTAGNDVDFSPTTGYFPVACEWVTGTVNKCFSVCGNKWLVRVDDFPTSANTYIDLEAAIGIAGIVPFHLRYNSVDGLLYIPIQNKDGVIVYDPTGVAPTLWKTGFDSPLDVVFTPTKSFAVQTGLVGLKEII